MKDIIENVANRMALNKDNIREFLNEAFSEIAKKYNLRPEDFQARAARTGGAFEACFEVIIGRVCPDLEFKFTPNVSLPEACMVEGGEADFAVLESHLEKRKLVAVIETKGAADKIVWKGTEKRLTRPGMLRTDTVKKAICNAYQVKRAYPKALFFIVTSHKPTSGNAKCMCDLAEGDIVDKIVDITVQKDLDEMIAKIKRAI